MKIKEYFLIWNTCETCEITVDFSMSWMFGIVVIGD